MWPPACAPLSLHSRSSIDGCNLKNGLAQILQATQPRTLRHHAAQPAQHAAAAALGHRRRRGSCSRGSSRRHTELRDTGRQKQGHRARKRQVALHPPTRPITPHHSLPRTLVLHRGLRPGRRGPELVLLPLGRRGLGLVASGGGWRGRRPGSRRGPAAGAPGRRSCGRRRGCEGLEGRVGHTQAHARTFPPPSSPERDRGMVEASSAVSRRNAG